MSKSSTQQVNSFKNKIDKFGIRELKLKAKTVYQLYSVVYTTIAKNTITTTNIIQIKITQILKLKIKSVYKTKVK